MTGLFKKLAKALAVPVVALMVPALAVQALAPFGHGTAHASSQAGSVEAAPEKNDGSHHHHDHHHSPASHSSGGLDDHHGACKAAPSPACDIVVCCLGEPCVADLVQTARAALAASLSADRMGEPASISCRPFEPPPRVS